MDEKLSNDKKQIMVVQDKDGKLRPVTGIDKDGNVQTTDATDPKAQNLANMLDVNTHDSFLEAFLKKMVKESENPSYKGIFIFGEDVYKKIFKGKNPDLKELEKYRIDPAEELQKRQQARQTQEASGQTTRKQDVSSDAAQTFQPYDTSKIDLKDLEKKGIRMEDLEPHLKAMSYQHKSPGLIEMNPEVSPGVRIPTKGRASLEEQQDGSLKVIPHYWQEKPNLDAPLYGVVLPDDVKKNIEQTRHAGKILDLELTPGQKIPCFVSRDQYTNTLEVLPVSEFQRQAKIKGTELSPGGEMDVYSGKKGLLEGFITRAGYKRDAYIQVDAANRNFHFTYDGLDRNRYAEDNKHIRREKLTEKKAEGKEVKTATGETRREITSIPKTMYGAEIPKWAHDQWKDAHDDPSKRANVKACYVKDMQVDGKGELISRWVKPNWEKGKFDFFKWNPDYSKKQATDVKPTNESRTQEAVNTKGKTVEATKGVNEPLKPGQQQATPEQKNRQQQRQSPPAARQSPPKTGQKSSRPKVG